MSASLSERLTAVVSALVAIAILGAAVTAQHARTSPLERISSLESDLRYQLDLTHRDDFTVYKSRLGELELTLDAWRKSPQSPEDAQLMLTWMRQAIQSTMPGENREFPTLPPFGSVRPIVVGGPSRPSAPIEEPLPLPAPSTTSAAPAETTADASPPADIMVDPVEFAASQAVDETGALQPVSNPAADQPPVETTVEPAPTTEEQAAPPEHSITTHASPPEPLVPAPTVEQTADHYAEQTGAEPAEPPAPVTSPVAAVAESTRINVNLAELSARIAGYHDGMAELDAALVAKGELSGRRLARLVAQAESLAAQYRFVRLYADSLTPEERRFVPAPRSMSETVAMLAQRAAQADHGGDVLDDFDAARANEPTLAERIEAVAAAVAEPVETRDHPLQ